MQNADGKMVEGVVRGGGGIRETGWSLLKSGRNEADAGRDIGKSARNSADGGWNVAGGGRRIWPGASDVGNGGRGVLGGVWDVREGGRSVSEGVQGIPNRRRDVRDGVFHTAKLIRNAPGISFDVENGVGNGWTGRDGIGFFKRRDAETRRTQRGIHQRCRRFSFDFCLRVLCVSAFIFFPKS